MTRPLKAVKDYRPRDPMRLLIFEPLERMTKALMMGDAMVDRAELEQLSRRCRALSNAIDERLKLDSPQDRE